MFFLFVLALVFHLQHVAGQRRRRPARDGDRALRRHGDRRRGVVLRGLQPAMDPPDLDVARAGAASEAPRHDPGGRVGDVSPVLSDQSQHHGDDLPVLADRARDLPRGPDRATAALVACRARSRRGGDPRLQARHVQDRLRRRRRGLRRLSILARGDQTRDGLGLGRDHHARRAAGDARLSQPALSLGMDAAQRPAPHRHLGLHEQTDRQRPDPGLGHQHRARAQRPRRATMPRWHLARTSG